MTGDRGRDNDDDDDLAVCLEITLQLPDIRLQIIPVEHNGSQCSEISEHMQHNQRHNDIQIKLAIQFAVQNKHIVHKIQM